MNTGRFFELDRGSSYLTEGVTVFNYTALKLEGVTKYCPEFPVYLNITDTDVTFFFHYSDDGVGEHANHINVPILSLPLVPTGAGNTLQDVLEGIYDVPFHFPSYGNDGQSLISESFKRYYSIKNDTKKDAVPSYSVLNVFNMSFEDENRCFLRCLLLDFLYDLEHSEVFMNSEHYEFMYSSLHDDFYCHSIASKAEFYYQRRMTSLWPEDKSRQDSIDDSMLEHLGDYLIDAERRWVECISTPGAEGVLYHGSLSWFSDIEAEMDAIYDSSERTDSIVKKIGDMQKRKSLFGRMSHTAQRASDWYIDRYNFMGTLKIWYGGRYLQCARVMVMAVLAIITLFLLPIPLASLTWGLMVLFFAAFCWLLPVFVSNTPRWGCRLVTVGRVNYLMPRLFASIVTAWFTLSIGQDIFIGFFDNLWHNTTSLVTSAVLLFIMAVFVYYEISRQNPNGKSLGKLARSVSLLLVAFLYSFVSGLFIIHFFGQKYIERNDYLEVFYKTNVFVEKDTLHRTFPYYSFEDSDQAREEIYSAIGVEDKYDNIRHAIDDTLNTMTFEQILQDDDIMRGLNTKAILVKSLPYLRHQRRYESVTGPVDSTGLSHKTVRYAMEKKKGVILDITWLRLWVFRNLLLQFSFFAMFIGVFLQLIFDERTVTHPL